MEADLDADALFRRHQELQAYVGWTDGDVRRVQAVGPLLESAFVGLIDDFYEEIVRHPEARKVVTGGEAQIERLKGTLRTWIRELFNSQYDSAYVVRRWKVGRRHVEIGLDQVFTNVALSRLRNGLIRELQGRWSGGRQDLLATVRSLNTLLDLDLVIIEEAYQAEFIARKQHSERQRRVTDIRTLLDVTPIGIAIAEDPECRSIRVNRSFARLLRVHPETNLSLSRLYREPQPFRVLREGKEVPLEAFPMLIAASRGVEVRDAEFDVVFPDGAVVNLFGHAAPLLDEHGRSRGAVGAFVDISEAKSAQERLLQSERLAAIGQMVTGLAHESGNALARSRACLEMLALEVEDRPEAVDLVARTLLAQEHLQQLYEEVRDYASPLRLERERLNLQATWRQVWANLELLRRGRDVCLREETGGIDLDCTFDLFRVQQVIRNILENSLAACPDPVEIAVSCSEASLKGRSAVFIALRDNGPGLSVEQRQRIFEPFFTTKTEGTGLGMAIALRIVEAHGGRVVVGPGTGRGAEILITLPRDGS